MTRIAAVLTLVLACNDLTGPQFARVLGEPCEREIMSGRIQGNDWVFTIRETVRNKRVVEGADGVLRTQTVISCRARSCTLAGAAHLSEADARLRCER